MPDYIELSTGYIKRTSDGIIFPQLPENVEYQDFLRWQAGGEVLQPYQSPAVDPKEQARVDLAATDKDMARGVEDLINALIAKGLMTFDDLPKPVIAKLENRANLRKVLQADGD